MDHSRSLLVQTCDPLLLLRPRAPSATDATAQETIWKVLQVPAQTNMDEVVLMLFDMGQAVPEVGGAPGRGEADKPPDSADLLILKI